MENYTEILKEYLQERRNVSKRLYKFMNTAYRAVRAGRKTWDNIINILGGTSQWKLRD